MAIEWVCQHKAYLKCSQLLFKNMMLFDWLSHVLATLFLVGSQFRKTSPDSMLRRFQFLAVVCLIAGQPRFLGTVSKCQIIGMWAQKWLVIGVGLYGEWEIISISGS